MNGCRNRKRPGVFACAAILLTLVASAVHAHEFRFVATEIEFDARGEYRIEMVLDLDALALGVAPSTDSAELAAQLHAMSPTELEATTAALRRLFQRRVRLRFDDGPKQRPEVLLPGPGPRDAELGEPTVLGTTAVLQGTVPKGAESFTFGASRAFGQILLSIGPEANAVAAPLVLERGADSPPHPIAARPEPRTRTSVARDYLKLGFLHIIPRGLDHILFVLGLFLLCRRWQSLLLQVTAFTVAHTLSLALSMLGLVGFPSAWAEALIALSIVYVAFENLRSGDTSPWQPLLVFAFGLLHGLGFAGVLREIGAPKHDLIVALLSFNVGVELGQLAVIGCAFAAVGWYRNHDAYRSRVVLPGAVAIGLIGVYWTIERCIGALT